MNTVELLFKQIAGNILIVATPPVFAVIPFQTITGTADIVYVIDSFFPCNRCNPPGVICFVEWSTGMIRIH